MRPIKFRAWDKDDEVMFFSTQNDFTDMKADRTSKQFPHVTPRGALGCIVKIMPLMQYTGLKDKNGKEIWEGDVVWACIYNNEPRIFTIEWVNIGFRFCDKPHSGYPMDTHGFHDTEVIGNIYENPNLIVEEMGK